MGERLKRASSGYDLGEGKSQVAIPGQAQGGREAKMWLGACSGCNGIYVIAGLPPAEAVCPECQLPLRVVRDSDHRDRCRAALGLSTTRPGPRDQTSDRAA